MKHLYTKRLAALEAEVQPPFAIPDDLSTLSDDDLTALWVWCARINGPARTAVIEALSEDELEAVLQMDGASAEAFIEERV